MNFYCWFRAASYAKQAALIPQPDLFMLAVQCPGLCWTVETFFGDFKIQLLMRDVHPCTKKCRALSSWKVLSVDSCFDWMWLYDLQPGLLAVSSLVTFLNKWEIVRSSPLNTKFRQLSSILEFIYWWLMMFPLYELWQVITRSLAASNFCVTCFLTGERWGSQKNSDSCQANLNFTDWWLIMFYFNELSQVTTRSLAASYLVTFSRQMIPSSLHKTSSDSCQAILNLIEWWLTMSNWMSFYNLHPGHQLQAVCRQIRGIQSSSLQKNQQAQ